MKGLTANTEKVFKKIAELGCIKEYTLIGGTALSLQIENRLSEDLDFCKWKKSKDDKPSVDWPEIEKQLKTIGNEVKTDVIDSNQVNFYVDGVKVSFYADTLHKSPIKNAVKSIGNIKMADIETIGVMKIEVMTRRSKYRDYYDIYSLIQEGYSVTDLVDKAATYAEHRVKTKNLMAIVCDGKRFVKEEAFKLLNPKYDISPKDIEKVIIENIKKDRSL